MRTVKILDDVQKKAVVNGFTTGATKTALANQFGVSVRTIGRVIDEWLKNNPSTRVQKPVKKTKTEPKMIGNESFIVLVHDGEVISANSSHPNFAAAFEMLKEKQIEAVKQLLSVEHAVTVYSRGDIKIIGHQLLYKDVVFDTGITHRIIREMHNNRPYEHLLNFFERLMQNPSRDAVYQLYGFLVHNDIELTEDGHFLAWKRVSDDYKDLATHTFDNSPGAIVKMDRKDVCPDKTKTCSRGLHVAAKSYLPHYGGGSGRIIQCKVDPADVVAIPIDYDNAKMRVCRYEVMKDKTVGFTHY